MDRKTTLHAAIQLIAATLILPRCHSFPFKYQDLTGDSSSLNGDGARVETFPSEIVKGVLPSRHAATDAQTGVPYFLRLAASNSLGFGEYGDNIAVAKAAKAPDAPGNLSAGVALHVDEVCTYLLCSMNLMRNVVEWNILQ